MSLLRFLYQRLDEVRKPSLEANLEHLRRTRPKGEMESARINLHTMKTIDRMEPSQPIEEVLRADREILRRLTAPTTCHLSEAELNVMEAGGTLPEERQQHVADCLLCAGLIQRLQRNEAESAQTPRILATPPSSPPIPTTAIEPFDIDERSYVARPKPSL